MSAQVRDIIRKIARSIWRFVTGFELLLYLCFVLLATLMWFGHAMSSVRNANIPVRITYVGVPQDMVCNPALPQTLDVEVRDAGNRLRVYSSNPLEITINLNKQVHGTDGEIYVSEEYLRRSISNILQGTSKLQHVTPSQIHVSYHKQEEKIVPICSQVTIRPASEYQVLEEPQLAPTSIRAYGYSSALDTLTCIYTEELNITDLRDTLDSWVHLIAPSGVRLQQDSIQIHIVAERFTEKTFVLPIIPHNIPDGCRLHLFPQETTVTLRCAMSHFANINENDIQITCDFPTDSAQQLVVQAHCDNPYVTHIKLSPSIIEFIIEK